MPTATYDQSKRPAVIKKNHSKYDIKLIDVCSISLLHLCLTTTSVLRLTTFSKTKYASAKRSVLLHFLRIPFLKESNCRPNELHCLLAHLHRTLITFSFLCNKSTYVTRVFSNFSDYTNINKYITFRNSK